MAKSASSKTINNNNTTSATTASTDDPVVSNNNPSPSKDLIADKENYCQPASSIKTSDKKNSENFINLPPRHRFKQKYSSQIHQTRTIEMAPNDSLSVVPWSKRIESIEFKLGQLQTLREGTLVEVTSLLEERTTKHVSGADFSLMVLVQSMMEKLQEFNPAADSQSPESRGQECQHSPSTGGLAKILSRLRALQNEYDKRRAVCGRRYNYRLGAIDENHGAQLTSIKNETESDQAETSVAILHKHRSSNGNEGNGNHSSSIASLMISPSPSLSSIDKKPSNAYTSATTSGRKRSLPAIHSNSITAASYKVSRRQSVSVSSHNGSNSLHNLPNPNSLHNSLCYSNASCSFPPSFLTSTSTTIANSDLLAIKARISSSLNSK